LHHVRHWVTRLLTGDGSPAVGELEFDRRSALRAQIGLLARDGRASDWEALYRRDVCVADESLPRGDPRGRRPRREPDD
jgi:hypothetical protein